MFNAWGQEYLPYKGGRICVNGRSGDRPFYAQGTKKEEDNRGLEPGVLAPPRILRMYA